MIEMLKSLWADPTIHQLVVSLVLTILMVLGAKLSTGTGILGTIGKLMQKIGEWFGSNPKH